MKSFLTWILWVGIGAGVGFALHFLIAVNLWILTILGGIVGSSIGFTINIHREEDYELYAFYDEPTDESAE